MEDRLCLLEVPKVIYYVLLCLLEVLGVPEVMRCVLLCILKAVVIACCAVS